MDLSPPARLTNPRSDKLAFFRQSGWMMLATVLSGVFMSAVHVVVSKPMKTSEYAVFFTLLRVFLLMGFPAGGLQIVFAQQAAAAVSEVEERKLSQTTRSVARMCFVIWLVMTAIVFVFRRQIITTWEITNPAALWVTVFLGLAALWSPILKGLLQGRQKFGGLGWVLIIDGVGRFTATALIVHFGGQAAGAMSGALFGQGGSLLLGGAIAWTIVIGPGAAFDWKPWLARVVPLTLGIGVVLFMSTTDVVYVQSIFSKNESPFYIPAAMIGLALITFATPLAAVMFPKIVHSSARAQKSDALRQALASTALVGAAAAIACTVLPELPLRIIYFRNPVYWKSATLVPWIAWSLVPLILANVLINNLLARGRFRIVPWLLAVALGYGVALAFLKNQIVFYTAADITAPASIAHKLVSHTDAVSASVWNQLSPEQRQSLSSSENDPRPARILVQALNQALRGPSLFRPEAFGNSPVPERIQTLVEHKPQGKELVELNRLMLTQAFPSELVGSDAKLFAGFKRVIGTLGVFSSLLLLVAMWFSFR
jgi:O-antigen/teichoic acid export membrane protein